MELSFKKSALGIAESAITPEGTKIIFVYRKKSRIIVYWGRDLIAECGSRQQALDAVEKHIQGEIK